MKTFMLVVFLSATSAQVSGPYTRENCETQRNMIFDLKRKAGGFVLIKLEEPREKGDVECLRTDTYVAPKTYEFITVPAVQLPGPGYQLR